MTDFNVKVTVRNAHLLRAIREKHETVADFCRASGVSPSAVSAILTFKISPFKLDGALTKNAEAVCSYLGKYPGELWPKQVAKLKAKKASAEIELSKAEVLAVCGGSEDRVVQRQLIAKWAKGLTPRQIEAIGIYQSDGTLDDVGEALGVSRERARQIIFRGFWKMRKAAERDRITSVTDLIEATA